jgi:hypothetical protein
MLLIVGGRCASVRPPTIRSKAKMKKIIEKIQDLWTGSTAAQRAYSAHILADALDQPFPNGSNPLNEFVDSIDEEI